MQSYLSYLTYSCLHIVKKSNAFTTLKRGTEGVEYFTKNYKMRVNRVIDRLFKENN